MGRLIPPRPPGMALSAPVPLASNHDPAAFDSGSPPLDDWLKQRALRNESRFSRTYVVCDGDRVVAFYSIAAGAVQREQVPGKLRRNAPDSIPVAIIGRLAVSKDYSGRGLGAGLLSDALRRIAITSDSIGIRAILVQAKDDAARDFYLSQAEFIEFPTDSRTLFLPIETVIAAAVGP